MSGLGPSTQKHSSPHVYDSDNSHESFCGISADKGVIVSRCQFKEVPLNQEESRASSLATMSEETNAPNCQGPQVAADCSHSAKESQSTSLQPCQQPWDSSVHPDTWHAFYGETHRGCRRVQILRPTTQPQPLSCFHHQPADTYAK